MADGIDIIATRDSTRPLESELYTAEQQGLEAENIAASGNLNIGFVVDYGARIEHRLAGSGLVGQMHGDGPGDGMQAGSMISSGTATSDGATLDLERAVLFPTINNDHAVGSSAT